MCKYFVFTVFPSLGLITQQTRRSKKRENEDQHTPSLRCILLSCVGAKTKHLFISLKVKRRHVYFVSFFPFSLSSFMRDDSPLFPQQTLTQTGEKMAQSLPFVFKYQKIKKKGIKKKSIETFDPSNPPPLPHPHEQKKSRGYLGANERLSTYV